MSNSVQLYKAVRNDALKVIAAGLLGFAALMGYSVYENHQEVQRLEVQQQQALQGPLVLSDECQHQADMFKDNTTEYTSTCIKELNAVNSPENVQKLMAVAFPDDKN